MQTEELADLIARFTPRDGSHSTAIHGLYLTRSSTTEMPRTSLDRAVFCVVAQGAKSTLLNDERYIYDPGKYLVVSLDLPLVGQIEEASRDKPFLGFSLVLDFEEMTTLIHEAHLHELHLHEANPDAKEASLPAASGLVLGTMDGDLLNAVTRLVKLLSEPDRIAVLAPLVRREIFYRLLISKQSGLVRRMVTDGGRTQRIASGLEWLKRNASRTIRMGELAREMRMSTSTMHSWFRAVTSMSPLQFQKQLRLQEARRVMLSESVDAGTACRRVGYESASQFSREYRRFFGAPPMRDIARLRAMAGGHQAVRSFAGSS